MAAAAFPTSVLVIDDEPVVLDLFQKLLPERGLALRTARSAEEAFALLDREGFGCVVADKNLPGTDGIEIVRQVRRAQPYCACILMTAYASTESAVEALRLGAVDYIEKPFDDLTALTNRIAEAVHEMRKEYERRALISRLHLFRGEPSQNDNPDELPGSDDELAPVEMDDARAQGSGPDLRRRSLHLLSRLVATKAAGREVLLSGEALLDEVRRLRRTGGADADELLRVEQALEDHLALARHAQSR
jgi:CheY-like chemotaxis protein